MEQEATDRQPSRRRSFAESVAAGLVANALTAAFIGAVAVAGGRLAFAKYCALVLLLALAVGALAVPVFGFRDLRAGRLPPEIRPGNLIVGGVVLCAAFGFVAWGIADTLR